MGEDDALGFAGGTGRELDECDVVRLPRDGRCRAPTRRRSRPGTPCAVRVARAVRRDRFPRHRCATGRTPCARWRASAAERRASTRKNFALCSSALPGASGTATTRPSTHAQNVSTKGREAVDQDDRLRIGARARRLQVTQQAERASAHFRVGNAALAGLAGDVVNGASAVAQRGEGVGEGFERGHVVADGRGGRTRRQRRSRTCMWSGCRVRRFTCGSISIVCPAASVRSNRRASVATCACISIKARCSPMHARGPSPKGRYTKRLRAALASGRNRSGSNVSGCAQYAGWRWIR